MIRPFILVASSSIWLERELEPSSKWKSTQTTWSPSQLHWLATLSTFWSYVFWRYPSFNNLLNKTDINVVRRKIDKKIKNCILCKKANLFFLGLKIVTYPPLCMYIVRYSRIHFDLLSQSSDMHVDRSCISWIIISPYCIQQIFSAVYFVWMKYQ